MQLELLMETPEQVLVCLAPGGSVCPEGTDMPAVSTPLSPIWTHSHTQVCAPNNRHTQKKKMVDYRKHVDGLGSPETTTTATPLTIDNPIIQHGALSFPMMKIQVFHHSIMPKRARATVVFETRRETQGCGAPESASASSEEECKTTHTGREGM